MQSAEISMQPPPFVKHPGKAYEQSASVFNVFVVGHVLLVHVVPQVHGLS